MTIGQSNTLKLLGVFLMVLDHISHYIIPIPIFRILGRLVFPVFAYQLTVGYQKTSNKKKYFQNLLIFGCISQLPYFLLGNFTLNIIFSLALGFVAIYFIEERKYLFLFLSLLGSFFVSYGLYGFLLVLTFYFYRNKLLTLFFLFALLNVFYYLFTGVSIQLYSFLALIPIYFLKLPKIDLSKSFFYIFYPLHLLLIYFIKILFF